MTSYEARLVISRSEKAPHSETPGADGLQYEARWVEADGQKSKYFALRPPLTPEDAADLRWYLEKYHEFVGAGTRVRAQKIEQNLEEWGDALFDAVFGTDGGNDVYRNLVDAQKLGRPVMLTFSTAEPEVLIQPWELMRDHEGALVFRGVSIRRQLEDAEELGSLELGLPLRLLLIVSRPRGSGFIDPRSSVRPLLDGLDHLPRGSVELEFCEPPTLAELKECLSRAEREKRPFHIVHFDGHGGFLRDSGYGVLCFETKDRKTDPVPGLRLGDLLSRFEVPLVILEACQTSDLSDKAVWGSVAPALLRSGVGGVVAFSHSIHVEASRLFVESFYRQLVEGESVGRALSQARSSISR